MNIDRSLKIVVAMGGPSGEHDISLKSGQGVLQALARRGWSVEPVLIPKAIDFVAAVDWTRHALQRSAPDVVFIALHGPFGEDGTVQQLCEELLLAYTGSDPVASRLGMDKIASRRRCASAGLCVPPWVAVEVPVTEPAWRALECLSYPLVVKPNCQGSSLGVSIVHACDDLEPAIQVAAQYGSMVVVEAFVIGRELTVGVLAEQPLPVVEIRPRQPFFDFTAKYTTGATDYLVPAPVPDSVARAVQAAGLAAHHALGCRHLSRADLILDQANRPVLLEVNTIPGFTPTSLLPKAAACAGISYELLCEQLVLLAHTGAPSLGAALSSDARG